MIKRTLLGTGLVGLLFAAFVGRSLNGQAHASPTLANMALTANNIHLAMIFNNNEHANKSVETGKVDMVWGADSGWSMVNTPAAGVHHDWYSFFNRDTNENSNHDLTWFQANHPNWIEYTCDRTTALHGNGWVEYDITNPAVQTYELQYVQDAMAGGFNGVDFDVTDTFNYDHACGHYDQNGNWVQQYSGSTYDDAYRGAQTRAFASLTQQIRNAAANRGISFTIAINPTFNLWKPLAATEDFFPYVDMVMDEGGFTNYGDDPSNDRVLAESSDYTSNQWYQKMQWYQDLHNMGKAVLICGEVPANVDTTNPPRPADVNWILANYLLTKDNHTYESLITGSQQYGGPYYDFRPYHAAVGTPTDTMHQSQGVWMRDFTQGLAIVNPSPSQSFTVRLPAGSTYTDAYGNPIGSTVTLAAGGTGLVLVASTSSSAPTSTPTATSTPVVTNTPRPTSTSTPVPTSTSVATATSTPKPTSTTAPTSTPTSQPTNTATPRPTNTPVPTATPPPPPMGQGGPTQLLANSGFEGGSTGWISTPLTTDRVIDSTETHGGARSAHLCGYVNCNAQLSQTVLLPANISGALLSFWTSFRARMGICGDYITTEIDTPNGTPLVSTPLRCNPQLGAGWQNVSYDVSRSLAPYAGQEVRIRFGALAPTGDSIYVDDVRLDVR